MIGIAAIVLVVAALSAGSGSKSSAARAEIDRDMCREAKEAAHYIASLSRTPAEVVRNTDRVIAERKYPTLGDKATALVGATVAQAPDYMTPDDIVLEIEGSGICNR